MLVLTQFLYDFMQAIDGSGTIKLVGGFENLILQTFGESRAMLIVLGCVISHSLMELIVTR